MRRSRSRRPTLRLMRVRIGAFDLDGLLPGAWRELNDTESALIFTPPQLNETQTHVSKSLAFCLSDHEPNDVEATSERHHKQITIMISITDGKTLDMFGWLAVRLTMAYVYLFPFYLNIKDSAGRKAMAQSSSYMIPFVSEPLRGKISVLFAIGSFAAMFFGGLSILFGIEGRVGGLMLLVFTAVGVYWHKCQRDVAMSEADKVALTIPETSKAELASLKTAAFVGHFSSGIKNWPLCGICIGFICWGTGPLSISDWVGSILLK